MVSHETFHLTQARPQLQRIDILSRPQGPHSLAIFKPLQVSLPREELTRFRRADAFNQFASQLRKARRVHQQHALIEQLDIAGIRREMKVLGQQVPARRVVGYACSIVVGTMTGRFHDCLLGTGLLDTPVFWYAQREHKSRLLPAAC
jgi:hypothetical protein